MNCYCVVTPTFDGSSALRANFSTSTKDTLLTGVIFFLLGIKKYIGFSIKLLFPFYSIRAHSLTKYYLNWFF